MGRRPLQLAWDGAKPQRATRRAGSIRSSTRGSLAAYHAAAAAQLHDRQPTGRHCCISQNRQQVADLQLQQTLTQTTRAVRNAYFDLVNAIAGLQVAQQSLDLARESLRNNMRRVEVGTMAPIDIVQAQAEVAANEESVIVAEGQIRYGRGSPSHARHEPVAA